jgi:radical SAM family uncharacterized protein/radical SAM-linked protein
MNFLRFQKPTRYIDSEYNAIIKTGPVDVRIALAFPDVYEIGMSHLGTRILYSIINDLPFAAAERAFAPWSDLRDHMRRNSVPLASLETKRPLNEFDMLGFSLQYELSYTTVLDMLDLSGIPLRTADRLQSSKPLPIIVAGGPSTVNPAPMSPFIDAFLIGDGEEAVVELLETFRRVKAGGNINREDMLRSIAKIDGFYVPHVHAKSSIIKRRFVADLDAAPFPDKPIVPYTSIVHDRVNIEVARGCTMGCRFCQAGIIYRPLRERSPENVIRIAKNAIANTGYDEISFSSLSTGDYSCLLPLIRAFNSSFRETKTAVSLPSLRVGSVSRDVLKEIRSVRKTGFTMAPEAATERLRSVINKDFSEEDYERALTALFEEGWLTLKLYFMIGLPTEREEDITAINEMAMKALRIAKRNSGKFVNINITVSPFIPKPHTPFQWHGQISLDEMKRKLGYLRQSINQKKFKYKGHNEHMSFLEAVFARGDERLADLIEEAWRSGCVLDGWSEFFDFSKWLQAMEKTGIDGSSYAERAFAKDDALPWDNIDVGVSRDFLYTEYAASVDERMTPDCRNSCIACGLKCAAKLPGRDAGTGASLTGNEPEQARRISPAKLRVRAEFSKTGMLRYLSHLELITAFTRALRRAGVPLEITKGFHPKPNISFGPPLNVGISGASEYFDMEVLAPFDVQLYRTLINGTLPEGLRIKDLSIIQAAEPSLTAFVSRYHYLAGYRASPDAAILPVPVVPPLGEKIIVQRDGEEVDISGCVESVERIGSPDEAVLAIIGHDLDWAWQLVLKETDSVRVRLGEITRALFGTGMEDMTIVRTEMSGWKNGWRKPL